MLSSSAIVAIGRCGRNVDEFLIRVDGDSKGIVVRRQGSEVGKSTGSRISLMSNRSIVAHTWPVSEPGWVHPISNPPNPPYPHKESPSGQSKHPNRYRAAALRTAGK
jgi:hypothetical protein